MNTAVRPAEPGDLAQLAGMFDGYRQFYGAAPDLALAHDFMRQRMALGDAVILLAERPSARLSGFCQLYPSYCSVEAAPIYVLYDLYVSPDARRAGVGRALLRAAAERGRADGKRRMDLMTARSNLAAQALYASEGWTSEDTFLNCSLRLD